MKRSLAILSLAVFCAIGYWASVLRQGPGVIEVPEIAPWPKALDTMAPPRTEPGILTGQILLADGKSPCVEALVQLIQGERVRWTWTDILGNFRINDLQITPSQEIVVLLAEHLPQPFEVAIDGKFPTQVAWVLAPEVQPLAVLPESTWADLTGQVHRGLPGASGDRSVDGFEVWLVPQKGSEPMLALGERRAAVGPDGMFAVKGLLNGPYTARVLPRWAHGGSWPVLGEATLEFAKDQTIAPLSIALVEGMVTGTLRDGSGLPVSGALLVLRAIAPEPQEDQAPVLGTRVWPPVRTEPDGTFAIVDLPPGDYLVELVAGEARVEKVITVQAGSSNEVSFGLIRPRVEEQE